MRISNEEALQNRYEALKFMRSNLHYSKKDIIDKYRVTHPFIKMVIKKGIIKVESTKKYRWQSYIDPNIRMATALFNDERNYRKQMLQKNTPVVDKVTPIVDKIIEKADNIVEKKEPVPSVKFSIQINITDKGIEMSKKDFINLVSKV